MTSKVALGIIAHCGWANAVAVEGDGGRAPRLAGRWRLETLDDDVPNQPYHVGQGMPLPEAEALVQRVEDSADRGSVDALSALVRELVPATIAGCAVVGPIPPAEPFTVEHALASHTRIHTAEGELYRDALRDACDRVGLDCTSLPVSSVEPLFDRAAALGQGAGPPWTKEHKLAAAAALVLLESA